MRKLFLFTISVLTFIAAMLTLFFISDTKIISPNSKEGQVIDLTKKDERDLGQRIVDYLTGNEKNKPVPTYRFLVDDVYLSNIDQPLHFMSEYNHLLKKIYINGQERTYENSNYDISNNGRNIQKQARLYSHELFRNLNLYNQVTLDLYYDGFLKDKHYRVIVDFKAYNFAFLNDNILIFKNVGGRKENATKFKQDILLNYGQYNWYTVKQPETKNDKNILDLTEENAENYFLQAYRNVYAYSGDYKKEATFTVTYKNEDNSTFQVQSVIKNGKIPFVPTPIKKGYNFEKWYISNFDGTIEEFDPTKPITKDTVLVPEFSSISYLIRYDTNNGILPDTVIFPSTYTVNDRIEIPKAQRNGYEFAGWIDERTTIPNKEYVIESGTIGNIELTAQWKSEEISVEFDYNDGTTPNREEKYQYNQTYNFERPLRKNYLFIGWQNKDTGEILNQTGIFTHRNKITLVAQWQDNTYNVKFYLGEEELQEEDIYQDTAGKTHEYTLEKNAFVKEPLTPTKKGHVFLGWYKDGNTRISFPYQSSIDTKIVALWRINQYILNFYPDGGDWIINKYTVRNVDEFGPVSYQVKENFGQLIQASPSTKKHGYDFVGWFRFDPKDPTKEITEKIEFPFTIDDKDESFKALWTPKNITINYDPNNGQMPDSHPETSEVVSFEKSFILPLPTRENYSFIGWTPQGSDDVVSVYELDLENENNLVAKWIPKKFIVNIVTNSDSYIPDIEKDYNTVLELSEIQTPIKTGYEFSHWNIESTQRNESLQGQTNITILENITLKAEYTILHYTISFDVKESKIGDVLDELKEDDPHEQVFSKDKTISYTIEDTIDFKNLKFPGYTFLGWAFLENGLPVKNLQITHRTGDFKLFAQWQNNVYNLRYYNENGYLQDTAQIIYKDSYKLRTTFKQGYTFISWHNLNYSNDEMNDTNKFTDDTPWEYLEDKNIYPKFEINRYKVHFLVDGNPLQIDGADYVQEVEYEGEIDYTKINNNTPEKEGYDFIGWYLADKKFESYQRVTYELFLVAYFRPKNYTLTYYGYGNDGNYSYNRTLNVEYGKYFKIPTDTINNFERFIFKSWHTTDQKENQTDDNKFTSGIWRFTENKTIYPRIENKKYLITLDLNGATFANEAKKEELKQKYPTQISFVPDENNPKEILFNFDYQEKDLDFTTFNFGDKQTKSDGDFLKEGYAYTGIKDLASSSQYLSGYSSYQNSMKINQGNITRDYTLLVVFEQKVFRVTYDLSNNPDKDYSINPTTILANEELYTPVISRKKQNTNNINNYIVFNGWERLVSSSPDTYQDIQNGPFTYNSDITIRPKWEFKDFEVVLDLDGAEITEETITNYNSDAHNHQQNLSVIKNPDNTYILRGKFNSKYKSLPTPTKTGYNFTNYKISTQNLNPSDSNQLLLGNFGINYYAIYTPVKVSVTLIDTHNVEVKNADKIYQTLTFTYDNFHQLPIILLESHSFLGWYKTPQPTPRSKPTTTDIKVEDQVFKLLQDETYYAWFSVNRVQVYISADGGVDPITEKKLEPYYFFYHNTTIKNPKTQFTNMTSEQDLAYSIDEPNVRLPIPKKPGYVFENYYFSYGNTVINKDLNVTEIFGGANNQNRNLKVLYSPASYTNAMYSNLYDNNNQKLENSKIQSSVMQFDRNYNITIPQRKGYNFKGFKIYKQKADDGSYDTDDQSLLGEISSTSNTLYYRYPFEITLEAQWEKIEFKVYFAPQSLAYENDTRILTEHPEGFQLEQSTNKYYLTFDIDNNATIKLPKDYQAYYFSNYYISSNNSNLGNQNGEFTIGLKQDADFKISNNQNNIINIQPYYQKQSLTIEIMYTKTYRYTNFNVNVAQNVSLNYNMWSTYSLNTSEEGYPGNNHPTTYVNYGYYKTDFDTTNVWSEDEDNWGDKYLGEKSFSKDFFPQVQQGVRNTQNAGTYKFYRRGKRYDSNNYKSLYILEHDIEGRKNNTRQFSYFPKNTTLNIQKDYLNLIGSFFQIDNYKTGSSEETAKNSQKTTYKGNETIQITDDISYILLFQKEPEFNITYVNPIGFDDNDLVYTLEEKNTTNQNVPYKAPTSFIRNVSFYIPNAKHKNDAYVFIGWDYTTNQEQTSFQTVDRQTNLLTLSYYYSIKLRPVFSPKIFNYIRLYKYPNGQLEYVDKDANQRTITYNTLIDSFLTNTGSPKGYEHKKYFAYKKDFTQFEQNFEITPNVTKFEYTEDVLFVIELQPKVYKILYETDGASYIDNENPQNSITLENNEKDFIYERYFRIENFTKKGYNFSYIEFNGSNYYGNSAFDLINMTLYESPKLNLIKLIFTPITYYIDYDHPFSQSNGNSYSSNPNSYIASGSNITLARPVRKGFTFLGWTSSDNPNAAPDLNYEIDTTNPKNLVLKSHWKAHKYEIRLLDGEIIDPNNPTSTDYVDRFMADYNESLIKPIPKQKDGYRFVSWNILTNAISFPFVVSDDKTRNIWQAQWTPISYEIKADFNGGQLASGESSIPQSYQSGSFIILPRLYKQYHIFKGWKDKGSNDNPKLSYIIESTSYKNIDVEAVFETEEYSLRINLNKGQFDDASLNDKKEFKFRYGQVIEELFDNNALPKKLDHIFTGWKVDGSTITFPLTITSNNYNGKVVLAVYQPINYTINYDLKGSLTYVGPDSYQKGENIEIITPEKPGYRFRHWTLKQLDDTLISDNHETYTISETTPGHIKLEANFEPITYKLYVDYQVPGVANEVLSYQYLFKKDNNQPLIEIKERKGYRFLGYYDLSGNFFNNKQYNVINDIFLQARWEKLSYNVTFINKVEGKQEKKETKTFQFDELYSQPLVNEEGYKVSYFFIYNQDQTEGQRIDAFPFQVKQDLTIGVKYELLTYNIYYDVRDGINNPLNNRQNFTIQDQIDVYPANKFGYTFTGWTIRLASSTQERPILGGFDGSLYKGDVIITAHWDILKSKVEFETTSQDIIPSVDVLYNQYVPRPKDPTKEGSKFMYWYKDSIYNPFEFDREKISRDTILYARYIPIIYITNIVHDEFRQNALIVEFSKFIDEVSIESYSYLARLNLLKHINISTGAVPLSITPIDYNKLELLFRPSDLTSDLYITFKKNMPILKDKIQTTSDIAILAEEYKVNFYIDRFIKTFYARDVVADKVEIENANYLVVTIKDPNSTTSPIITISNDDKFELVLVGLVKTINQYRYKVFIEKGQTIQGPTDITVNIKVQGENEVINKNFTYTVLPNEVN